MPPRKRDPQETLGRSTEEHIFISPEIVSARASERAAGKRRWGAKRSDVPPEILRDQAEKVRHASDRKAIIVPDPNVYFIIAFSDSFRSPIIRRILEKLRVQPIDVVSDMEAKVKIRKSEYSTFLRNLESNSSYVKSIRESTLTERIDESLLHQLEANPEVPFRVRIELTGSPESGLDAVHALEQYLHSKNVEIERSYYSKRFWLITAQLLGKFVQELGENSDGISRINLASAIKLHSSGFSAIPLDEGRTNRVRTSSLRTTPIPSSSKSASLPIVCVLDTGINRDHKLIKPFVVGTYDLIAKSDFPCSDDEGHGTKVAGLAIYGGDVTSGAAVSRVIAVKLMKSDTFDGDILRAIHETVQKFKGQTKIFNLSFGTQGPEPGLSRSLDYYAFDEGVLFIVSAGNILPNQIMNDVGNGNGYPGYLLDHWVYFPGDCYNVLTVGSYATKESNFVPQQRPSPFTRTSPPRDFAKPEVLASGGNMNLETQNGRISGFNATGCGVISTGKDDDSLVEDVGTSFSSPTVASIVAELVQKFPTASTDLLKALVVSSSELLSDGARAFDYRIQGFGVPSRQYATYSSFSRVNLCADSAFDLSQPKHVHRYKFLFPDNADRIRITLCCQVEPVLGPDLPYEVAIRLHKQGTKFGTQTTPSLELPSRPSNIVVKEYEIKRGGKGSCTLELKAKAKPGAAIVGGFSQPSRYGLVVTIISSKGREIYPQIDSWLRRTRSPDQKAR